jgi:hypothetical protein
MEAGMSLAQRRVDISLAYTPRVWEISLHAGDKSGRWKKWYEIAIPAADERFEDHLTTLKEEHP